jgi:hypothetical protein
MVRLIATASVDGHRLKVRCNNGLEGIYPVEPDRRGGAFLHLKDPAVFNAVRVNPDFGCVEWPGGVDLCPTSMHAEMLAPAEAAAN